MDTEIIQDIKAIRKGIERSNRMNMAFLALMLAVTIFISGIGSLKSENFKADAEKLFESAEYEKLGELISKRKNISPNDPDVYLYLAQIQILKGQHEEALKSLERLRIIAPKWEENTIKPLIESINESASNKSLKDAP